MSPRLAIAIILVHVGFIPAFVAQSALQEGIHFAGIQIIEIRLDSLVGFHGEENIFLVRIGVNESQGIASTLFQELPLFLSQNAHYSLRRTFYVLAIVSAIPRKTISLAHPSQ